MLGFNLIYSNIHLWLQHNKHFFNKYLQFFNVKYETFSLLIGNKHYYPKNQQIISATALLCISLSKNS